MTFNELVKSRSKNCTFYLRTNENEVDEAITKKFFESNADKQVEIVFIEPYLRNEVYGIYPCCRIVLKILD